MKQSQKIIKKGDYYEIEVIDDAFYSTKTSKKEESQINILPPNQNIIVQLPSYNDARAKYFDHNQKSYSVARPDVLLHQLQDILNNQKLNDEDKQEIHLMIKQIKLLKEEPLVSLNELMPKQQVNQKKNQKDIKKIDLKARLDVDSLQKKIIGLQKFAYPEISKLQHQLEILLGEKKTTTNVSNISKNDSNKEDIDNLYALFNGLTYSNNLSGLINKIHDNNGKFVQIQSWAKNLQATIDVHSDFLAQLKQDEQLLNNLEESFKSNIKTVKDMIQIIKKQSKK